MLCKRRGHISTPSVIHSVKSSQHWGQAVLLLCYLQFCRCFVFLFKFMDFKIFIVKFGKAVLYIGVSTVVACLGLLFRVLMKGCGAGRGL